jgi:hypothetical protein
MTLICTKNPVSGDQNNSIKTTPLRSLLNNILTRHFSERRVDNSHLEKGEYLENCRGINQGIDITADLMKKIEPCREFVNILNIV